MINMNEAMELLIAAIKADATVAAIVGDRVYNHVPQGTAYPYLGVQFVGVDLAPPKNGAPSYQTTIRIDASSDYAGDMQTLALHDALVAALHHADIDGTTLTFDCLQYVSAQFARGTDGITHLASYVFSSYFTPTP